MTHLRAVPIFTLTALLLAGCGPSNGDGSTPAPPAPIDTSLIGSGSATVQGYLANSTGGMLVAGSTITVEKSDGTTLTGTTNAEGKFTLKLDPGSYNLVFKKTGYAGSRIDGVRVVAGTNQPLNAIQKNAFATTLPVNPPKVDIQYLVGAEAKSFSNDPATAAAFNASTGIPLQVTTTSDEANSPAAIYAGVGGVPGSGLFGSRFYTAPDPKNTTVVNTFKLAATTLRGVRGPTELYVVAYDTNENRYERRIPIVINDDVANTAPLTGLTDAKAYAVTLSQKVNFNAPIRPDGAPAEISTLWVDLSWTYNIGGVLGNPTGIRIWTSDDGSNFRLLKTVEGSARVARDGSGSLEPGKKVYYQFEAYNSAQSVQSEVVSTTPLNNFTLSNFKPAEASRDVSRKPTLAWDVSSKVGDYRKFYVMVNDYPQQSSNCFWGNLLCTGDSSDNMFVDDGSTPALTNTGNTYSVPFNANGTALLPALESYHAYTFDVAAAAFSKSGDAVSIAQDYYDTFYALGICNFGGPVCEGQVINFTTGDKE